MEKRLSFLGLLRQCLVADFKEKRYFSLFPWKILACIVAGISVTSFFHITIDKADKYIILITGLVTAQGIMLGMSTNAIQHVIQNISSPGFSKFLADNNVLKYYLFFIQYFQVVGVFSLIVLIISAIIVINFSDEFYIKIALGVSIGCVLYSLWQTADTSVLMRDIVFYRSKFDRL